MKEKIVRNDRQIDDESYQRKNSCKSKMQMNLKEIGSGLEKNRETGDNIN